MSQRWSKFAHLYIPILFNRSTESFFLKLILSPFGRHKRVGLSWATNSPSHTPSLVKSACPALPTPEQPPSQTSSTECLRDLEWTMVEEARWLFFGHF